MSDAGNNVKWLAIAGTVATVTLSMIGLFNFMRDAIVSDLVAELERMDEKQNANFAELERRIRVNNAENKLQDACWADASMAQCDQQLASYMYCYHGKVSKDVIAR